MFENIIGQEGTIGTLRQELDSGSFPSAVLFHGPPFSGKLSAALEAARVLTCAQDARWNCSCPACGKQRRLIHPNMLLMGRRYFDIEIAAAADVLRRARSAGARYLFVRAVRKLTRRFDPVLWEGEEKKVAGTRSALAEIEEHLDAVDPGPDGGHGMDEGRLEQRLDRVVTLSAGLSGALSFENIPINQLRRAAVWLHHTALSGTVAGGEEALPERALPGAKIVILEGADKMYGASSSSMLKLLEEPPPGAHLILITSRRSAVIPTVLSRLRPYLFGQRPANREAEILQRIFHEAPGAYRSLRQYFLYWKEVNPDQLEALVHRFITAVLGAVQTDGQAGAGAELLAELRSYVRGKRARDFFASFLEELLGQLLDLMRAGRVDAFLLSRFNREIRRHQSAFASFNQQPELTLESLFYSLRSLSRRAAS